MSLDNYPEPPPIYESEAKIREKAKDARQFLQEHNAEDLIEILGLEDDGQGHREDSSPKTSGKRARLHSNEFGRIYQRGTHM